jgi:putative copper resistance protein D
VLLTAAAVVLGGVCFLRVALRAGPGTKPDEAARHALRLTALGAAVVAAAQLAVAALTLGTLVLGLGAGAASAFGDAWFARASCVRVVLALATAALALALARGPAGPLAWAALTAAAGLLVATSASISHAMARLDHRAWLLTFDATHQLAAAVWVGGLVHLVRAPSLDRTALRRFSSLAAASVVVLVASGFALSVAYAGDPGALVQTAYGVMVLTKTVLLVAMLALGFANFRAVRAAAARAGETRLARFVEVEAGLAITVVFAAASLTSLPPAVDIGADRATLAEVGARFSGLPPRLASPDVGELLRQTDPLAGGPQARLQIEREWSEFNHHWAGLFVLAMGLGAIAHRAGVRAARHWPLFLVGLALFLFVRNDPEVWPLGPIGFFESLAQPEILQHRLFMLLVTAFGLFEWAVRTGRLSPRPWASVFPVLCAAGGGLLLTHSHTVFSLKEAFLMEVTHAPIGVLGAFAGWARWLELRLPEAGQWPGRVWSTCLVAIGVLLIVYSEGR